MSRSRFQTTAAILFAAALAGCAATYDRPTLAEAEVSSPHQGPSSAILASAKQALLLNGYQITHADDTAGVISTAPRKIKITPDQADCGTTMGIDYLLDARTDTSIALNVIVGPQKIIVKGAIAAEYKPGTVTQNIQLQCVSRGTVERDMLARITRGQ